MISTKALASDPLKVPSYWVFEYYCNLSERLSGQDLKLKSVFNPTEKTPSFCIYVKNDQYFFKDFSSGKGGNALQFIKDYFNLSTNHAAAKMVNDYNESMMTGKKDDDIRNFQKQSKYQVTGYVKRGWTKDDADFWVKYHVDSETLERFNVVALDSYTMTKDDDKLIISGKTIYGYLRLDDTIYKVYQPKVADHKFLKVKNYIQGTDQLKFNQPNLVICSSLKDAMCLTKFGYNTEVVAPDSENALIPPGAIAMYKLKYKSICTLFDNDIAGIKAMEKYQDEYNIPGIILPMSKDLSDSVRDYGIPETRKVLHPLLKEALKK